MTVRQSRAAEIETALRQVEARTGTRLRWELQNRGEVYGRLYDGREIVANMLTERQAVKALQLTIHLLDKAQALAGVPSPDAATPAT